MIVRYHPDFSKDIEKFEGEYTGISDNLAIRFREEVDAAIEAIKNSPYSAGHILQVDSKVIKAFRRRNFRNFPFFILYGVTETTLFFGAVIPSRSDPLTWLARWGHRIG